MLGVRYDVGTYMTDRQIKQGVVKVITGKT